MGQAGPLSRAQLGGSGPPAHLLASQAATRGAGNSWPENKSEMPLNSDHPGKVALMSPGTGQARMGGTLKDAIACEPTDKHCPLLNDDAGARDGKEPVTSYGPMTPRSQGHSVTSPRPQGKAEAFAPQKNIPQIVKVPAPPAKPRRTRAFISSPAPALPSHSRSFSELRWAQTHDGSRAHKHGSDTDALHTALTPPRAPLHSLL